MTVVCSTYILIAPEGLRLPYLPSLVAGVVVMAITAVGFAYWKSNYKPDKTEEL